MFTGIVRTMGRVGTNRKGRLSLRAGDRLGFGAGLKGAPPGASVAVSGVCLTVTRRRGGALEFDVGPETLRATTLGALKPGDGVNLEPSLRSSDELGGHFVSGHVDARGTVLDFAPIANGCRRLRIEFPGRLAALVVAKGSVAVDGVSLTVAKVSRSAKRPWFEVMAIPHTLRRTTLGRLRPGDAVNLEADLLARYVENILRLRGLRPLGATTPPGAHRRQGPRERMYSLPAASRRFARRVGRRK